MIWRKTAVSAHFHTSNLIAGPGAAKVPESGSKRLPARIWRKTAVSAHFQTGNLIAGPGAAKVPESGSKKLPARIWRKTAADPRFTRLLSTKARRFLVPVLIRRGRQPAPSWQSSLAALGPELGDPYHGT